MTTEASGQKAVGKESVGIALLGAGRWGVNLLRNFLALPECQVVAIADADPTQLARIRQQFDLSPQVLLTSDWQAALTTPGVTAAVVATPASSHYTVIHAALSQGLHVLAEKPLTLTVADSQALDQLAKAQQRQLVVDHTYLFNPAVTTGQAVVQQQLGQLRYGYASRTNLGPVRPDVNALWDLAIHDIAIFNYWLGETPIKVQAQGLGWLQPRLADLVWAQLIYPSGFQAQIHVSWVNPDKQRRLGVVGDQGSLIFDDLQPQQPLTLRLGQFQPQAGRFLPANLDTQAVPVPPLEPLKQVCQHFLDCVQQNQPTDRSSAAVGADLVGVLVALSDSLDQGGAWVEPKLS
jgi:predicted dehydrogenase